MSDFERRPLSVAEAAQFLGYSPRHVYRLAQARVLPGYKPRGRWYFFAPELCAWIDKGRVRPMGEMVLEAEQRLAAMAPLAKGGAA